MQLFGCAASPQIAWHVPTPSRFRCAARPAGHCKLTNGLMDTWTQRQRKMFQEQGFLPHSVSAPIVAFGHQKATEAREGQSMQTSGIAIYVGTRGIRDKISYNSPHKC